MMYFTIYALMFGGPVLGLIALTLFAFRVFRPVRLTRTIGWLCAGMSIPVVASFIHNTGYPLLIMRPATAFLGLLGSIAYLMLRQRLRLPVMTTLPSIILLLGSTLDAFSVYFMSDPGFAGGSC